MEVIILLLDMAGIISFGYFVMRIIDKFLNNISKNIQFDEPKYVMFFSIKTDSKIMEQISAFRKKHSKAVIILCENKKVATSLTSKG